MLHISVGCLVCLAACLQAFFIASVVAGCVGGHPFPPRAGGGDLACLSACFVLFCIGLLCRAGCLCVCLICDWFVRLFVCLFSLAG